MLIPRLNRLGSGVKRENGLVELDIGLTYNGQSCILKSPARSTKPKLPKPHGPSPRYSPVNASTAATFRRQTA